MAKTVVEPIRWLLFLYGGRVVPYDIRRTDSAQSPLVQDVRSGATTYGHRFLTTSGRAGRAVKVKTFDDYKARLLEHFVVLEREDRRERIARELDVHAGRLGGRVHRAAAGQAGLLDEVPDLVEWPSVVAGVFPAEFLRLISAPCLTSKPMTFTVSTKLSGEQLSIAAFGSPPFFKSSETDLYLTL